MQIINLRILRALKSPIHSIWQIDDGQLKKRNKNLFLSIIKSLIPKWSIYFFFFWKFQKTYELLCLDLIFRYLPIRNNSNNNNI